MKTNIHLVFPGTCREAFALYEKVFKTKRTFAMTFAEAPEPMPVPDAAKDMILYTSMPLGSMRSGARRLPGFD